MKMILAVLTLISATVTCRAAIVGRLTPLGELGIQNGIGREVADGLYDVVQVVNGHTFYFNKADGNPWPVFPQWKTGLYHGFNINQRGDHFGITSGPVIYNVNVTPLLDAPINMLGLSQAWKPSTYITVTNSVQSFVGYRPVLNGDIMHRVAYGGMFVLQGTFTINDVKRIITGGL